MYCKKSIEAAKKSQLIVKKMSMDQREKIITCIRKKIKENAEAILNKLGIPVSVFIDMTYRQVIMHDGIPFSLEIPNKLATRDQMSELEFNTMMATGLAQAKADDSYSVDDAFANLRMEIGG